MIYVVYFWDHGKIKAMKCPKSLSCTQQELKREIAIACGLNRGVKGDPESRILKLSMYSTHAAADMIVEVFNTEVNNVE